ncbi:MAG: hypothetical protein KAS40_07040, partial [Desulfobacterales bacterium]|nr:hypothetical protein [Desulfobacterales bacterium]
MKEIGGTGNSSFDIFGGGRFDCRVCSRVQWFRVCDDHGNLPVVDISPGEDRTGRASSGCCCEYLAYASNMAT